MSSFFNSKIKIDFVFVHSIAGSDDDDYDDYDDDATNDRPSNSDSKLMPPPPPPVERKTVPPSASSDEDTIKDEEYIDEKVEAVKRLNVSELFPEFREGKVRLAGRQIYCSGLVHILRESISFTTCFKSLKS